MKRIYLLVFLLFPLAVQAQWRYSNPVLHTDFSDPDVCRVGDDYYMTASSFNFFPGLPILHSRDLVHWEQVGAALTDYPAEEEFFRSVQHGNAVWAPAIRYHDGMFYIFCGDPDRGIFMVRTSDPCGPWEEPVWVVRSKGFIDPCPLWDDDGKAYLSHASAGSRAGMKSVVYVAPMSPDGTRLTGPSRIVYDGHATQPTIEGTKFYKRDGRYYIFAPAGGVKTGWQTVLRSDRPFGPYEERIVMASAEGTINGPHQGGWVSTPSGGDWFLHFQDKGAYGRIVHLQPMQWKEDGWPLIGEDPDGDGIGQPVKAWSADGLPHAGALVPDRPENGALYRPYGLPLEWQYAGVPYAYWHFALPEDGFRLFSVRQAEGFRNLWDSPNLLTQKFPAERFVVTAKMSLQPNPELREKGEEGGFLVMGEDYAGLRLKDSPEGGVRLQYFVCRDASDGGAETVTELPLSGRTVWVKLEVRPAGKDPVPDAVCRFSYSFDGKRYTSAGKAFTAKPGRWVGAHFGFYCNRYVPKNDSGSLEVTDIRVKPEFAPLAGFVTDEASVPDYGTLPDVFALPGGRKVTTVKQWEKVRRPELLSLFEKEMYGPSPGQPQSVRFRLLAEEPALDGLAVRKEVEVTFDDKSLTLLLYVPSAHAGAVPAFLGINFGGNHTVSDDPSVRLPDTLRYRRDFVVAPRGSAQGRWPLRYILEHGFAVATFCCEDVAPDADFGNNSATLAAWAGGLSRALDYLEEDPDVAGDRVAVLGFSRMGKAALWAGARDTRFAMVISNCSGCCGAALSRREYGETVESITHLFPHWFCGNFSKYASDVDALPFDQHELLALIAPRPVYVASAEEDAWADPTGERLSLQEASRVYAFLGLAPSLTGYHIHEGPHSISLTDWRWYLDFADRYL